MYLVNITKSFFAVCSCHSPNTSTICYVRLSVCHTPLLHQVNFPLSSLNLTTVILCITTFKIVNLIGSNRFKTLSNASHHSRLLLPFGLPLRINGPDRTYQAYRFIF